MRAASIIICTRDRAVDLADTLAAFRRVASPTNFRAELLVVDNGSTDRTAGAVAAARLPEIEVRYVLEPRSGKGYAYNAGIGAATGDVLLFTDDDVRVPVDWIERMCRPILDGEADAVAGGVRLAPHLVRPWMTAAHRAWLASTERLNALDPGELVGANMAFSRAVLDRVGGFDPELGPGAVGFADDTQFAQQLKLAGYRIAAALDVEVEHHFDPSRLKRRSFLKMAERFGRTQGYLAHHCRHAPVQVPAWRAVKTAVKLRLLRLARSAQLPAEGMPDWEMALLQEHFFYRQFLRERKRLRRYGKDGLMRAEVRSSLLHRPTIVESSDATPPPAELVLDAQPDLDEETLAALEQGEAEGDRGEVRPWEDVKAEIHAKYLPK